MNTRIVEQYPLGYQRYATQYKDLEVIGAALWDTLTYTSGTTLALTFFNATRATLDLSNMEVAGQLAAPKAFLVRALRFYVKQRAESVGVVAPAAVQTGAHNNIWLLTNTGVLSLTIGSKNYGVWPLWKIPAGGGVSGALTVANILVAGASVSVGNNGAPHAFNVYTLSKPLFIEPQINFQVTVTWAAAVTLTRNLDLSVVLEGDLMRPVQ